LGEFVLIPTNIRWVSGLHENLLLMNTRILTLMMKKGRFKLRGRADSVVRTFFNSKNDGMTWTEPVEMGTPKMEY
jgi:hypothetical protein